MANDMCTKRLTHELTSIQKNPLTDPVIHTRPLESNILEWHYVVEGPRDTPYEGGYYWGKLIFPVEYPMKPPSVIMLTPNGRFKVGRKLCLSISDYHPESWHPAWNVGTILVGLISFMVGDKKTGGSIETTTAQKKKYAESSLSYNRKDKIFSQIFPEMMVSTTMTTTTATQTNHSSSCSKTNNRSEDVNNTAGGEKKAVVSSDGVVIRQNGLTEEDNSTSNNDGDKKKTKKNHWWKLRKKKKTSS